MTATTSREGTTSVPSPGCTHGMPTPASCFDCMEDGNLPPRKVEREEFDYSFVAKFTGQCPICDLPIVAGMPMARTTRDRNVHLECAP